MNAGFCAACGAPLPLPAGAGHRACTRCGTPSYANPAVYAACVRLLADASAGLWYARVAPGETIQACALRALGCGSGCPAEQQASAPRLALYCALTDLDRGEVCLVFRLRDAAPATPVTPAGELPGWGAALCSRFATDCAAGRLPVYTASVVNAGLDMSEVPADHPGFSASPA